MPWKECNHMDERLRFVARLLDGEKMAVMCREFGISRKTGYKIFNRYKDYGLRGLEDRIRTPHRHPNKLPFQIETAILRIKREHMSWGAPKIRQKLIKAYPVIKPPAAREYHHPEVPDYPFHDQTIRVTQCGRICLGGRKISLSAVFGGQHIGIREVADKIWLVSFMTYDLGFFDEDENRVEPVGHNPFAPKMLPMSSE